jgi:hypothetical protein
MYTGPTVRVLVGQDNLSTRCYISSFPNRKTGRERLSLSLPVFTLLCYGQYDRDALSLMGH